MRSTDVYVYFKEICDKIFRRSLDRSYIWLHYIVILDCEMLSRTYRQTVASNAASFNVLPKFCHQISAYTRLPKRQLYGEVDFKTEATLLKDISWTACLRLCVEQSLWRRGLFAIVTTRPFSERATNTVTCSCFFACSIQSPRRTIMWLVDNN